MTWDEAHAEYILQSGRRVYANGGIMGVGVEETGDVFVSEGSDGGVGYADDFTDDERREIGHEMIARWQRWVSGS